MACSKATENREDVMPALFRRFATTLAALLLSSGFALAQSKVTIAIGGASCLCYLPTMLAESLGEFKKAGVEVDVVQFKGGSESLNAVVGGSADVASGTCRPSWSMTATPDWRW
jgi:NitT/TauT family transport system substrate-binding protein